MHISALVARKRSCGPSCGLSMIGLNVSPQIKKTGTWSVFYWLAFILEFPLY
nr:MAG TPA: hypothetical protein [Caudoviricetes sp.]